MTEVLPDRGHPMLQSSGQGPGNRVPNHNPAGLTPRGLGFAVGEEAGSRGCSARTFGHTGSTGTLCWADPVSDTICVVLTSLPARAVQPHPRDLAAERVAQASRH